MSLSIKSNYDLSPLSGPKQPRCYSQVQKRQELAQREIARSVIEQIKEQDQQTKRCWRFQQQWKSSEAVSRKNDPSFPHLNPAKGINYARLEPGTYEIDFKTADSTYYDRIDFDASKQAFDKGLDRPWDPMNSKKIADFVYPIGGRPSKDKWRDPSYHLDENPALKDRKSFVGPRIPYKGKPMNALITDNEGRPLNPYGRTGLPGLGVLGKYGPNQAADAIPRIKVEGELYCLLTTRHDTGQVAFAGGMIDPLDSGKLERSNTAAFRELTEEALTNFKTVIQAFPDIIHTLSHKYSVSLPKDQTDPSIKVWFKALLENFESEAIYRGYVDDPRNTDHAWMETTVFTYDLPLDVATLVIKSAQAGDDAKNIAWYRCVGKKQFLPVSLTLEATGEINVNSSTKEPIGLYASHADIYTLMPSFKKYVF